jgi:hypothetical protein
MNSVNVHVSVVNLPQIDRHQNDIHKNPIINQGQNAHIARTEAEKKLLKPNQADSAEGKNININNKQQVNQKRGKKRKNETDDKEKKQKQQRRNSGFFVDVDA